MADATQFNFRMNIDGEDSFEVYRFGFDPAGFHPGSGSEANSDSINVSRFRLQSLCSMIEMQKTMLFTKRSDLVTVGLLESYLKKLTLEHILFVVTETAHASRTTAWVAALNLQNVSITGLKARQQLGVLPGGERLLMDFVWLRAEGAVERDYDAKGRPELKLEELRTLNNQNY
jgi:hypothetical protein